MKLALAAIPFSLLIMACASTPKEKEERVVMVDPHAVKQVVASGDDVVICRNQHKVGTHFKTTRCLTKEALEAEREAAKNVLMDYPKAGPGPVNK